jgi:hypothetical protein
MAGFMRARTLQIAPIMAIAAAILSPARSFAVPLDAANVVAYGAVGDGATDDCGAFTKALATGKAVYAPKPSVGYRIACQLTLTANGQEIDCDSRRTWLLFQNAQGPQIVIGGSATQSQDISIRSCQLVSKAPGQPLFFTRYVRGFRLFDVLATADQFMRLGDASLGPAHPTYIVELYDGVEAHQIASPTLNFIDADNFAGQWVADNAQLMSGCASPCPSWPVYGWNSEPNIQQRIDHFVVTGGYMSRFKVNYHFADARVVNAYFVNHHSENATDHAFEFSIPPTSTRPPGYNGAENIFIANTTVDSIGPAIYVSNAAPHAAGFDMFSLTNVHSSGMQGTQTPLYIEQVGPNALVYDFTVSNLSGYITPSDGLEDGVLLKGDANAKRLFDISVRGVTVSAFGATPLRSGVRLEGAGPRSIDVASVDSPAAGLLIDDETGVFGALRRDGGWTTTVTTSFAGGAVAPNSAVTSASVNLVGGAPNSVSDTVIVTPGFTPPAGVSFTAREVSPGAIQITMNNGSAVSAPASNLQFTLRVVPSR